MKSWWSCLLAALVFAMVISVSAISQPLPVTIIAPSDSASGIVNPIHFTWTKSPTALAYLIQVSTDRLFGTTLINQSITDTTLTASPVTGATKYYWRVRAENLDGASAWASAMFIKKLNIPTLNTPAQGGVDIPLRTQLSWSAVFSPCRYLLQISLDPQFNSVQRSIDTTVNTLIVDTLSRSSTYYWRVKAYIKGDTSAFSSPGYFSTIPNIPAVPELLSPGDASTNNAVNVVMRWSKIADASAYQLQVSSSPIFSTLLVDVSCVDTFYRHNVLLNPNTQYYWKVKSTNKAGESNYTVTHRFTTGTDTTQPKILFQQIDLGNVQAGTSKEIEIPITNTGNDNLIISGISTALPQWEYLNNGSDWSLTTAATMFGSYFYFGTSMTGVFRTADNGKHWEAFNTGLSIFQVNAFCVMGNQIFAATEYGLFRSAVNEDRWTPVELGILNRIVRSIASVGTELFAGTDGGSSGSIFRSANNGVTWERADNGVLGNTGICSFTVSGKTIYAATDDNGVFVSTDNGNNWSPMEGSVGIKSVVAAGDDLWGLTRTWDGLYRFVNSTMKWSKVNTDLLNNVISALAGSGNTLLADNYGGIFLSTDKGTHWTETKSGLMDTTTNGMWIWGSYLYTTAQTKVYRSPYLDCISTESPSMISPGKTTTAKLRINSMPTGNIVGKIIVSSNASTSPDTIMVTGVGASNSLALGPGTISLGNVKIGNHRDTVFTLLNTGNQPVTVTSVQSTSPAFTVTSAQCIIPPQSSIVDTIRFTSTVEGAFGAKIIVTSTASSSADTIGISANAVLTGVEQQDGIIPSEYSLSQNYPNPFNPSTSISFGLPEACFVTLKVYDAVGRDVVTLVNAQMSAGYHRYPFNGAGMASGIYFYRLTAASVAVGRKNMFSDVKKLLLMK